MAVRVDGDVQQLERFVEDSYPKGAIVEHFVNRLDANIRVRDTVLTKFQGSGTACLM